MFDDLPPKGNTPIATLLLAHGAGASVTSDFFESLVRKLTKRGVQVLRFDFAYMRKRLAEGRKMPPPRADKLVSEFREMLVHAEQKALAPLFIGGKSMGSRVATLLGHCEACESAMDNVRGFVAFGFPFHAPKKPPAGRIDHLQHFALPLCIVQGTRDKFGTPEEVKGYALSSHVQVRWVQTCDHDFKPLKRSGMSYENVMEHLADNALDFMKSTTMLGNTVGSHLNNEVNRALKP